MITETGENLGTVPLEVALEQAKSAGLDLVEISPNNIPPVCKVLDFGKYKYDARKRQNANKKKTKVVEVKEIKMRPSIDVHDYDTKVRNMLRFFKQGNKVKVTIRFKGREMAHKELGRELLLRVKDQLAEITKVELEPKLEGRQMIMILVPR